MDMPINNINCVVYEFIFCTISAHICSPLNFRFRQTSSIVQINNKSVYILIFYLFYRRKLCQYFFTSIKATATAPRSSEKKNNVCSQFVASNLVGPLAGYVRCLFMPITMENNEYYLLDVTFFIKKRSLNTINNEKKPIPLILVFKIFYAY